MTDLTDELYAVDEGTVELVRLIKDRGTLSRAEVGDLTGWARVTVNQRLDRALVTGLVVDEGTSSSSRGRPAARFGLNPLRAQILVADIGASGMRLAATDLLGRVLRRSERTMSIAEGPEIVLTAVAQALDDLRDPELSVWGVGVSVPGPVEFATGTVVSPPIMTGWDGTNIPEYLGPRFGPLVFVDNDVNAMVSGERAVSYPSVEDLLLIKVGTGVGAGIIANSRTVRGAQGAAGDLGHIRADVADADPPLCRCGKLGCVEAYAGGWAIIRDLVAAGRDVRTVDDVVAAVHNGDAEATRLVREAGRVLGSSAADAVGLLNPAVIVLAGQLSSTGEHLLSGVRERIYSRSLPLAMRDLRIAASTLDGDSGVHGLVDGVLDRLFTVGYLNQALAG